MAINPQPSLKIPLILVLLGLIGYIGTNYYTQQQEFTSVRSDLENTRKNISENVTLLQQQSEQRNTILQKLSQDQQILQKKLSEMDLIYQTEKKEKDQLIFSQQEAINLLKEQQDNLTKTLALNATEIKEIKEVQVQMIPTTLETRKIQQQIDTLKPMVESISLRLSNLQEQVSIRSSMQNQSDPTKNPNPLRNGFP